MIRKLMICPYFGELPEWWDSYQTNIKRLAPHGYDFHFDRDTDGFRQRARDTLDVFYPPHADPRKPCAYRPVFGVMYADLIHGYDFWGHTDLDCVYGRVDRFVPDQFLQDLDVYANHVDYVSGPWTLYRNTAKVNNLFRKHPGWQEMLEDPREVGWAETSYTVLLDTAHEMGELRRVYKLQQTWDWDNFDTLHWDGDRLMEDDHEVMMAHFRRTKSYPAQLR